MCRGGLLGLMHKCGEVDLDGLGGGKRIPVHRKGGGGTTAIGGRLEPSAVYPTHARTYARTHTG